ncbi:Cyclin-D5-1 [Vitis vinifera]|uniref:Cyclin-D5-1 n=1 Tax=Vitis vinifera TaxID=29760 RepID=A0A438FBZ9_VITVI|nr:Cyclin-D5-1 [Vitis vinifera]
MENSDTSETSYSLPSLLCQENEACFGEEEQDQYMNLDPCLFSQSEDEYIQSLVKRETKSTMSSDNRSITNQSWLKRARLDSIKWVLNTRAFFGFQYRTAYLCVAYFDLFLSRRSIDNERFWATGLLSVACLSLAAKMEELRVPNLSEFPVEGYYFDNKVIRRMELMVLETLEWKMLFHHSF